MLAIIKTKATPTQIKQMYRKYSGYIKVVVDIERKILSGGSERHFEDEQKLLADGSKQENLWGGGIDWETKEIDYNSIINLRPQDKNPSRDILSLPVRQRFNKIVKDLLL